MIPRMRGSRLWSAIIAALVVACSGPGATDTPRPSGGDRSERLVMGVASLYPGNPYFLLLSNLAIQPEAPALARLAHTSLYRYDDSLSPVPDLAAEPCTVGGDGLTITCTLKTAEFSDGSALTADDVVFTYELARRSECGFTQALTCLETLEAVSAIDERTVEFRLSRPDASFLTLALPLIFIDSQAAVEAAYAPIAERAEQLDAVDLRRMADRIEDTVGGDPTECEALVEQADAMYAALGATSIPQRYFETGSGGAFEPCNYIEFAGQGLSAIADSLETTGYEALTAAYPALPFNWEPIGAGAWRFRELPDARTMVFEANPGYHGDPPATPEIEFRVFASSSEAVAAIRSGEVQWYTDVFPDAYKELRDEADVVIAEYDGPAFSFVAFNVREGRLFADRNLRTALELCIDKPATVDAATGAEGSVIYSPIEPVSWAYWDELPRPPRDVEEARRLIEESGWQPGPDGVYERDGRRLGTDVYVRSDNEQYVRFMDLLAEQASECGFDLRVVPADPDTVFRPLNEYPHIPAGSDEPFDAMFFGWGHGFDPHDILFDSRYVSSEENPSGPNVMGFSNPRVDALLDEGISTYDQRARGRIYRDFQAILAEERPVLFAWAWIRRDAISPRLRLADGGEMNLDSFFWFWQMEKLVVDA
ncbi:MAG: ABC transporter substrate-binding protein [Candidatus Limnocylindria bacterium]